MEFCLKMLLPELGVKRGGIKAWALLKSHTIKGVNASDSRFLFLIACLCVLSKPHRLIRRFDWLVNAN